MAVKILNGIDVVGSHNLVASDIPNLDAGKITSGTISASRLPNMSATYAAASHNHSGVYQPAGNYFTDGDTVLNMANNDGLVYNDSNNLMYVKADGTNYPIIDSRGGTITGSLTLSGGLNMNNGNITNINSISIGDPGPGEGINFGGTWSIWNSPNDLTTNTGGNLQFVRSGNRSMTIDTSDNLYVRGNISAGNRSAIAVAHWSAGNNTTGAIKITVPGSHTSNWSMFVLRITTYEYNANEHSVYYVSGHDWTSGWYNKKVTILGETDKEIALAFSDALNKDYIIIGTEGSTWSYGHVTVDVMAHPSFYNTNMDIATGWVIEQVTDLTGLTIETPQTRRIVTDDILSGYLTTSGKAADANLLDGINSTSFLRSDAADTATGALTFEGATTFKGSIGNSTTVVPSVRIGLSGGNDPQIQFTDSGYNAHIDFGASAGDDYDVRIIHSAANTLNFTGAGSSGIKIDNQTVWNAGNDGSGSGLDADLLDGKHASAFALASHTHSYLPLSGGTITGALTVSGSTTRGTYTSASQYHSGADNIVLKGNGSGISSIFFESEKDGTNINHPSDFGFIQYHPYGTSTSGEANELIIGVSNDANDHLVLNAPNINGLKFRVGASATDYTVWHSGNFTNNSSNWNTAYNWGDHAAAGYATAFHSHDDTDINNWSSRDTKNIDTYNPGGIWATAISTSTTLGDTPNNHVNIHNLGGDGVDYQTQLATYYGGNNRLWVRSRNDTTNAWMQWDEIITSDNIGSQSVNYASNANKLDNISSESFLRSDADDTLTRTLVVDSNGLAAISYKTTGGVYVPKPAGADYATTSNSHTGAIAIKLPTTAWGDSDMLSFWVDIYDYAGGTTGESISLYIYGYQYSTTEWTNCGATILSDRTDRDFTVRFGHDGTRPIVWIGETTSTWNYLQVSVRDFQAGYSGDDWSRYDNGWDVVVNVTSFDTVTDTSTGNYPVAKYASTAGSASSADAVAWSDITSKPTTFAPSAHDQAWSTITGTPTTIAGYGISDAFSGDYNDLINKPAIPVSGTDFDPVGTDNSTDVTLNTTSYDYLSISGQEITLGQIDYSTDIANKPTLGTAASSAATDFVAVTGDTMTGVLNLVQTNATPLNISTAHSSYTAVAIKNTGTGNAGIYFDAQDGDLVGSDYGFIGQNNIGYMEYHVGTSSPAPYHIFSTGNVGIGTTAPVSKLQVEGDIALAANGVIGQGSIYGNSGNSSFSTLKLYDSSTGNTVLNNQSYDIQLNTAGGTKMIVKNGGNVGIGTTSPDAPLHVAPASDFKVLKLGDDLITHYKITGAVSHVLTLTCGSYYQAEVVITANQTNSGGYNNLYIRGIWSNNYTSHHWDVLEEVGYLTGSSFDIVNGQNDVSNSGKLVINHNYSSSSFAGMTVRVTDMYGTHSYTIA